MVRVDGMDAKLTFLRLLIILAAIPSADAGGWVATRMRKSVAPPALLTQHRIFVSSATYLGNLGGLSGADAKCQLLGAARWPGTTWKAILSTDGINAKDRMYINGPIYNTKASPELLATNAATLWDGNIGGSGLDFTESGGVPSEASAITNTTSAGLAKGNNDCGDWTLTSGTYNRGRTGDTGASWIEDGLAMNCGSDNRHLYCIDQ